MKTARGIDYHERAYVGKADEGVIKIFGKKSNPFAEAAIRRQIGMVPSTLCSCRTHVLQNIILGRVPKKMGLIDTKKAASEIGESCAPTIGLDLTRASTDFRRQKQRVELVKALYRGARTSGSTSRGGADASEIDMLMEIAQASKSRAARSSLSPTSSTGHAITDTITGCEGSRTGRVAKAETTPSELSLLMVGAKSISTSAWLPIGPAECCAKKRLRADRGGFPRCGT